MLAVIIAITLTLLFSVLTIVFVKSIFYIGLSSIGPLAIILFMLYMSIADITFRDSGMTALHTSDTHNLDYDELAMMYKTRSQVFITGIIPELYLVYSFNEVQKTLLSSLVLILFLILSFITSALSIKKMVNERFAKESREKLEQERKESLGLWKK